MASYFVTRHSGARDWARRRGIADCRTVEHLDTSSLRSGDIVMGTLPVHLAAEVCSRGARYLHLTMSVPEQARGRELSADEMERFGASLQEYRVTTE